MNFSQGFKIGLIEIRSNKLRSFLTTLGVVFGVAAVIASVAIGEGAQKQALEQIEMMGTNNIRVRQLELEGQLLAQTKQKNPKGLSGTDIDAIRKNCPYIETVCPVLFIKDKAWVKGDVLNAEIVATTWNYPVVANFYPVIGRFLVPKDLESSERVCVIGAEIREELFSDTTAIGETVRIGNGVYVIIGIMEDRRITEGSSSVISVRNLNRDIYIPFTAALKRHESQNEYGEISELTIRIDARENLLKAASLIEKILLRMHGEIRNFEVIIPMALLQQSQATQKRFNLVLAAVAGISLLVGGIGIMNIMLAGVTQRIQEIGIRRAIGATRADILTQFLIEAVVLSLIGGIMGIISGIALGYIISTYAGWQTIYSIRAILLSFFVAASVGVIFGIFPARKASTLNPIEALRYE